MIDNLKRIEEGIDTTLCTSAELEAFAQHLRTSWINQLLASMPDLAARLDNTGHYIICGRINCGARIAQVHRFQQEEIDNALAEGNEQASTFRNAVDWNYIAFPAGWAPGRDGVWRLSAHAKQRQKQGQTPKLRRYPKNHGMYTNNDVMGMEFGGLPVAAVCPTCGFANAILPEVVLARRILLIVTPSG
jgi:hypothetical protein